MSKITPYVGRYYHISSRSPIIKQLSARLTARLTRRYLATLSYVDAQRARKELELVKSIRRKLKKAKLILRETDKSGNFHIGRASDYAKKAATYRTKTGAYMELPDNPLAEIMHKVAHLLNDLRKKKHITARQHKKMMPNRQKVRLAHMYFNPKAHKVII
jgi:phosphotransacetylase